MVYQPVVFNENALRNLVKETSKKELKKVLKNLRWEIKRIWQEMNKIRESILVLEKQIENKNIYKCYNHKNTNTKKEKMKNKNQSHPEENINSGIVSSQTKSASSGSDTKNE